MKSCKTGLFALMTMAGLSLNAHAVLFSGTVPGSADPWLAGTAPGATASAGDVNPDQSPVFAGSLIGLTSITWIATGNVDHTGGAAAFGPSGNVGALTQHLTGPGGVENGIAQIDPVPINSLIGVWYDNDTGTGVPFFMGAAGAAAVPAGADALYLGTMDGFGWYNNSGEFQVQINPDRNLPEGGSFTVIYLAAGALMAGSVIRKLRRS